MPLHPIGPEGSAGHQPGAPTIGTASAGDATASVAFNAPSYLGKPIGTIYTATSTPGGITATSSTTPITVTGLTNGTSYTFKVKLSNSITSSLESASSNSVTPSVPFGFTPFGFTPFGFTPFGFTPFSFTPTFSFAPMSFFFTPAPFSFFPEFSVASSTGIRTPNGIIDAQYISVGDTLQAMEIDTDVQDWTTWSSDTLILNEENLRETTVVSISTKIVDQLYSINGDLFSDSHYILTKKDNQHKFIKISELDTSYMIYSYVEQDFINIVSLEVVPQQEMVYSINCEPYDNFFTENMLVFDTPDQV